MSTLLRFRPPRRLDVSIGGYPGPSYRVCLNRSGRLVYEVFAMEGKPQRLVVDVPEDAWRRFAKDIEAADVANWAPSYRPPSTVCDGTSWSLELEHNGRIVKSDGSNAYPDGDQPGPRFNRFLRAIERLVSGEFR